MTDRTDVAIGTTRAGSTKPVIDALGIPFMFERDAAVISTDPTDGTPIRVEVRGGACCTPDDRCEAAG